MKATFIIGLCGSGKTTLAKFLARQNPNARLYIADDDGKYYYRNLRLSLLAGRDCIIEDICQSVETPYRKLMRRTLATVPGLTVHWIAFQNDLYLANWNCALRSGKRDAKRHILINTRLSQRYTIPPGAKILPIHQIAGGGRMFELEHKLCCCGNCPLCHGTGRLRVSYLNAASLINGDDDCMSCPHCVTGEEDRKRRGQIQSANAGKPQPTKRQP